MDINIVLSLINTKLRDFYSSKEELLDDMDSAYEMVKELEENGYEYSKELNRFVITKQTSN